MELKAACDGAGGVHWTFGKGWEAAQYIAGWVDTVQPAQV